MPALVADGLAELSIELALGRQADAGVWDEKYWDRAVWAQSDTALGDWVDVSCYVVDDTLALAAGADSADGVVTRWEAATAALSLVGEQFNPWAGPYVGLLGPNLPVRVRWRPTASDGDSARLWATMTDGGTPTLRDDSGVWAVAFQGATDDDGYTWAPNRDPARATAALACTDGTRLLATFDQPARNPVGHGDTAGQRVARILDSAEWPAAQRDIDPGGVTLRNTTLADDAWSMLLQVSDTDLALLWLRRDGRLAYRAQGRVRPPQTVAAVLVTCLGDADDMLAGRGSMDTDAALDEFGIGWAVGNWGALSWEQAGGNGRLRMDERPGSVSQIWSCGYPHMAGIIGRHVFAVEPGEVIEIQLTVTTPVAGRWTVQALLGVTAYDCYQIFNPGTFYLDTLVAVPADVPTTITARITVPTGWHYIAPATRPWDPHPDARSWWADDFTMRRVTDADEVQMQTMAGGQPTVTRNIVSVSRQSENEDEEPYTATVRDEQSIARYLPHSYQRTDLIHLDDAWSDTVASQIVVASAWPSGAPQLVALDSRLGDPRAVMLLLGIEFDQALAVDDSHTRWRMAPVGWSVEIGRRSIKGTLALLDVGGWVSGAWDTALWNLDTWGF